MNFLKKCFRFLRPFYDLRILILLGLSALIGFCVDPAATLGLAGYLAYVIGMAGAALMLTKLLMPYMRTSEHIRSALAGNYASALVVLARTLLLLGILLALMAWGK